MVGVTETRIILATVLKCGCDVSLYKAIITLVTSFWICEFCACNICRRNCPCLRMYFLTVILSLNLVLVAFSSSHL